MKKIIMISCVLIVFFLCAFSTTAQASSAKDSISLSVEANDATSVQLVWTDDSYYYNYHDGYKIYRANSKNGTYKLVKKTDAWQTSYTDKKLSTGKTYYYKVCRFYNTNPEENGKFSNVKSVVPIPGKMSFSAVAKQKNKVALSWEKAEAAVDGYVIYRASSQNGTYSAIKRIKSRSTTSYTDTTAKHGQFYYYKMRAYAEVNGKRVYGPASDSVRNSVDISLCQAYFIKVGDIPAEYDQFKKLFELRYGNIVLTEDEDFGCGSSSWWSSNGILKSLSFFASGMGGDFTGSYTFELNPLNQSPRLQKVSVTNSGIDVIWEEEPGAIGYKIYRRTGSGSYIAVKTITDNSIVSWKDETAKKINTKYTYFVKAYTKKGSKYLFTERSNISTVTRISTPKLNSVSNTTKGIVLKWTPVKGAKSYDILRKTENGSWKYISNTTDTQYTDVNTTANSVYTYTVCCSNGKKEARVSYYNPDGLKIRRCVTLQGTPVSYNSVKITWNKATKADGYVLYRATSQNGTYKKIATIKSKNTLSFTDKNLTFAKYYYYKIKPYTIKNGKTVFHNYGTLTKIRPTLGRVSIKKATATTHTNVKVTWEKVAKADGYQIYMATSKNGTYKKVGTVSKNNTTSYTVTKLKNANTYYFKVRAYRKVNQTTYYGGFSTVKSCFIDMLGYKGEFYSSKMKRIWGTDYFKGYASAQEAEKNMKTIKIKTWDINASGKKYTRYHYLTVNKNIATTVEQIFKEIYNGKEKFPIKSVGGYNWRGGDSTYSEHNIGLAIDINPNENAQFDGATGKPLTGSLWKPGTNPYSIKPNGDVVKAFEKYGFYWGDWFRHPDYMHFSYLGT